MKPFRSAEWWTFISQWSKFHFPIFRRLWWLQLRCLMHCFGFCWIIRCNGLCSYHWFSTVDALLILTVVFIFNIWSIQICKIVRSPLLVFRWFLVEPSTTVLAFRGLIGLNEFETLCVVSPISPYYELQWVYQFADCWKGVGIFEYFIVFNSSISISWGFGIPKIQFKTSLSEMTN